MISFAELSKQVHIINDMILSDMICDAEDPAEEAVTFSKHVLATKFWFARISFTNKKRYLLTLLHDVRSAWTLSLLLKSIWNCRPKDAVMSVGEAKGVYTSYDQAPMDHNRTALPASTLAQAMKNDRLWFLSLHPEAQAVVLSELLTVAGGPAMWEVLHRAQDLYDHYRERMMQNLTESATGQDTSTEKSRTTQSDRPPKKDYSGTGLHDSEKPGPQTQRQKEVEANLASWNSALKSLQNSFKLEELEITLNNGDKRTIWKVCRPKPDIMETMDFLQLLPSSVGKKILSLLPRAQLGDYARVNKYWAYLVEEYRAELATRAKIDAEFEKSNHLLRKHDESVDYVATQLDQLIPAVSERNAFPGLMQNVPFKPAASIKASEKSGGAYSLRYFSDKLNKPLVAQQPIRNMSELNERMERRGATDENIWKWCENIVEHTKKVQKLKKYSKKLVDQKVPRERDEGGILSLGTMHFPCPLMKRFLEVPLVPPLYKDPAKTTLNRKPKKKLSDGALLHEIPKGNVQRYGLWTRDVSPLYPVLKLASHINISKQL